MQLGRGSCVVEPVANRVRSGFPKVVVVDRTSGNMPMMNDVRWFVTELSQAECRERAIPLVGEGWIHRGQRKMNPAITGGQLKQDRVTMVFAGPMRGWSFPAVHVNFAYVVFLASPTGARLRLTVEPAGYRGLFGNIFMPVVVILIFVGSFALLASPETVTGRLWQAGSVALAVIATVLIRIRQWRVACSTVLGRHPGPSSSVRVPRGGSS